MQDEASQQTLSLPSDSLIGTEIGHYSIRSLLGVGGMGEVYLADDNRLNRKVALKVVPPQVAKHQDQMKRFLQEARASSALNHPNILTIHEFGTENGSDFIVSEHVDGQTVRQRLAAGGLTVYEAVDIARQVASALAAAHEAGIVHRDIKPENIMIRRDGIVKVLDFGLAKLTLQGGSSRFAGAEDQTLLKTAPGIVMGTVNYMSPEQARGVNVDGRTDIWSLGVVIYEMVAGRLPFQAETQTDALVSILYDKVPAIENFAGDIPEKLQRITELSLAKNADDRYATMAEMAADLKSLKNRLEFEGGEIGSPDGLNSLVTEQKQANEAVTKEFGRASDFDTMRNRVDTNPSDRVGNARTRTIVFASILALVVIASVIGMLFWRSDAPESAAVAPPAAAPEPAPPLRTLTYWLTVQSFTDGRYKAPFTLSGEMLFRNRDRVRINVRSPQSGHLYILNQGPEAVGDPLFNILFPSPTANDGSSRLSADQEVQIPQQSWFELDAKEGTEAVVLVWSDKELPELESAKRFANPEDKGRISDPELNREIASLILAERAKKAAVERDDDKKLSLITGNTGIVTHTIKLEHH